MPTQPRRKHPKVGINWETYGAQPVTEEQAPEGNPAQTQTPAPAQPQQRVSQTRPKSVAPPTNPTPNVQSEFPSWMRRSAENDSIYSSMAQRYGKDFYNDAIQQAQNLNLLPIGEVLTEDGYVQLQEHINELVEQDKQDVNIGDFARLATTIGGAYMGRRALRPYLQDVSRFPGRSLKEGLGPSYRNMVNQGMLRRDASQLSKSQMENIKKFNSNPNRFRNAWAAEDALAARNAPVNPTPSVSNAVGPASDAASRAANVADDVVNTFDDVAKRGLSGMEGYGRGAGRFISTIPFGVAAALGTAGYMLKPHQAQAAPHPEVARRENERQEQTYQNLADRFIQQLSEIEDVNQMQQKARTYFGNNDEVLNYVINAAKIRRAQSGRVYGVDRNQAVFRQGR